MEPPMWDRVVDPCAVCHSGQRDAEFANFLMYGDGTINPENFGHVPVAS